MPRRAASLAVRVALLVALTLLGLAGAAQLARADAPPSLGGPVIIGGDDLNDHGSESEGGEPEQGWLYITKAIGNISPQVTKANDNTIAALGPHESDCCDTGRAIAIAAQRSNLTVEYVDGEAAIDEYLAALDAGTKTPRILYISGDGGSNDLGDNGDEGAALARNATAIGDFVNAGGGLFSHGSEYRWLFGLLPNLSAVRGGGSDDLYKTPEGEAAFPDVPDDESGFDAGPWHNHFEGDFGGLQILVRSSDVDDSSGNDAAVIIGGSSVTLPGAITLEPQSATNAPGESHTVTATVRDSTGAPIAEREVTFTVTSGPNQGKTGTDTTDGSGQATFTYTGDGGVGTDVIEASFVDDTETTRSTSATKTWQAGETETGPAPPPPAAAPPPPEISVSDAGTVVEKGNAVFTVSLSRPSSDRIAVDFSTGDGSARGPGDYAPTTGAVFFEPGETSKSISVATRDDTTDEPDETFVLRIANPSNASIGRGTGSATVQDDGDPPPLVAVLDVTVVEGDPTTMLALTADPFAVFTLGLSEPSGHVVTVDFATADGTALAGRDYTPTSGTATFQPGETRQTVAVPVTPNREDNVDRTFFLRLGGGSNHGGASDGEAQATIQDDDEPPPPVPGESGNASVKSGTILIKLPGTDVFVPLTGPVQLPIGTVVDASKGTIILEMSDGAGGTYEGEFSSGIFTILEQTKGVVRRVAGSSAKPKKKAPKRKKQTTVLFTTLRLEGGDFAVCAGSRALAAKAKPKPVRRLWGNSTGKFRTKGRHSAATVRGTRWLTSDRCDGTLTYVAQGGPVSVLDFARGKTVELRQGQSYLARPRGRR